MRHMVKWTKLFWIDILLYTQIRQAIRTLNEFCSLNNYIKFHTWNNIFMLTIQGGILRCGISKLGKTKSPRYMYTKLHNFKEKQITCFSMEKKCCHVRMLSPNKCCSKDNLDRVIDVQQYNPLIHQQLRESKIKLWYMCYHWRAMRQIHRVVSSCCATQHGTKWQAPERWAKK